MIKVIRRSKKIRFTLVVLCLLGTEHSTFSWWASFIQKIPIIDISHRGLSQAFRFPTLTQQISPKNHSLFPPSPNSHISCELLKATSGAEMQMCRNVLASKQILHDSSRLQFLCRIMSSSANQVQPRCLQCYVCWSGTCKLSQCIQLQGSLQLQGRHHSLVFYLIFKALARLWPVKFNVVVDGMHSKLNSS